MHTGRARKFDHWDIGVDPGDPPADLRGLVNEVDNPEEGFFGPGTMMWRVARESGLFLSGMTCIMLQLSHPRVAPAFEHSDYEEDPQGRFRRTFEVVDAIVFGDVETALEGAMIVRELHQLVTGELEQAVGPFEAGERYEANDPDLLLWVHATLIHQSIVAYETYVEELTDAEAEQFYQDSKTFGQLFGIPREHYPETVEDFHDYFDTQLDETIALGDAGEEVRDLILDVSYHPGPDLPSILRPVREFFGAATMPEAARETLGLQWTRRHELAFRVLRATVRLLYPKLPLEYRYKQEYRKAMQRVASDPTVSAVTERPLAADD